MVTIKELAKRAGVSPTTVSNVLHGKTGELSATKLAAVQAVIDASGYAPNMAGRLLAKRGSRIIGVILFYDFRADQNAAADPFNSELIGAIEAKIRESGYYMLFRVVKTYKEALAVISSWDIEGTIVFASPMAAAEALLDQLKIPLVFIDTFLEQADSRFYNVGLADEEGGRLMGQYLKIQGKQRVAFLSEDEELNGVDLARYKGLCTELANSVHIFLDHKEEKRHQMLTTLVNKGKYDALFFASDFYAVDSLNLLRDLGLHIAIVGFDDNILARQVRPRLTTIHQEPSGKGFAAMEMLLNLLKGQKPEVQNLVLPVKLVIRDSAKNI